MAALIRSVLRPVPRCLLLRGPAAFPGSRRAVSNSGPDSASASGSALAGPRELPPGYVDAEQPEVNLYDQNPDYHGFSSDPVVDVWNMRLAFFFGISLAIVVGSTFVHYLPDHGMRQWARREAERRLKQYEAEGLPPISENYYHPSKIILPPPSGSQ
ncbi:NADH dehydrogenase [ubiquinone] 1 beta subcomplex subunit 11, mitochondrial [Rhincodon typus]|uniref:NADH dehydrogenase [ubiquinone] 1 beta subcomplex subunit 11, mitochondrial n=1 Tax=Rhincodon typus TaxID=259920 RepID=UPI00202F5F46|nr:NADH dehydrogenase [ubiquinone] 1 beta subcomplex subunit 11, mitochondrial [Rhincodon typus]